VFRVTRPAFVRERTRDVAVGTPSAMEACMRTLLRRLPLIALLSTFNGCFCIPGAGASCVPACEFDVEPTSGPSCEGPIFVDDGDGDDGFFDDISCPANANADDGLQAKTHLPPFAAPVAVGSSISYVLLDEGDEFFTLVRRDPTLIEAPRAHELRFLAEGTSEVDAVDDVGQVRRT
jgi:hypothetical protein